MNSRASRSQPSRAACSASRRCRSSCTSTGMRCAHGRSSAWTRRTRAAAPHPTGCGYSRCASPLSSYLIELLLIPHYCCLTQIIECAQGDWVRLGAAGRVRAARRTTGRVPRDAASAVPDEHGHGATHAGHAIFWPWIGIGAGEVEFTFRLSCFSVIYIYIY
jgi:hypothetical protein